MNSLCTRKNSKLFSKAKKNFHKKQNTTFWVGFRIFCIFKAKFDFFWVDLEKLRGNFFVEFFESDLNP